MIPTVARTNGDPVAVTLKELADAIGAELVGDGGISITACRYFFQKFPGAGRWTMPGQDRSRFCPTRNI